jgi:hypothetical protein
VARFDPRVLAHAVWLAGTIGGIAYLLRDRPSELWLYNAEATPLAARFAQTSTVIAPGHLGRFVLPPEPNQRVQLSRGGHTEEHVIVEEPVSREVVLLDPSADAGYVAVDASDLYQAEAQPGLRPGMFLIRASPPGPEHRFPRARDAMLGPGEPLPLELTARGNRRARSSVYKVYRVEAAQAADPPALVAQIHRAVLTTTTATAPAFVERLRR